MHLEDISRTHQTGHSPLESDNITIPSRHPINSGLFIDKCLRTALNVECVDVAVSAIMLTSEGSTLLMSPS